MFIYFMKRDSRERRRRNRRATGREGLDQEVWFKTKARSWEGLVEGKRKSKEQMAALLINKRTNPQEQLVQEKNLGEEQLAAHKD